MYCRGYHWGAPAMWVFQTSVGQTSVVGVVTVLPPPFPSHRPVYGLQVQAHGHYIGPTADATQRLVGSIVMS
jgi:hypothetical protein